MATKIGTNLNDVFQSSDMTSTDILNTNDGEDTIMVEAMQYGWIKRVDGGAGDDTVVVELASGQTHTDRNPYFAVTEVDPILYDGYTHRLSHFQYLSGINLFQAGNTLLRDVETLQHPDGTTEDLTTGSLPFFAKGFVKTNDEDRAYVSSGEVTSYSRLVISLEDGTVARGYQDVDSGQIYVKIFDNTGTEIATTLPFGEGTYTYYNPFEQAQTLAPQLTKLQGGGFAVTWIETFDENESTVASSRPSIETTLYMATFDADGTAREDTPHIIYQDPVGGTYDPLNGQTVTTLANGNVLIGYQGRYAGNYTMVVVDPSTGAIQDSTFLDVGNFPDQFGIAATDDGFVVFYENDTTRDRDDNTIYEVMAQTYTFDTDSGAAAKDELITLFSSDPDDYIQHDAAYAYLGDGAFAAAFYNKDDQTLKLAVYKDGAVTLQTVMPDGFDYAAGQISLIAAPGGGAYLSAELSQITGTLSEQYGSTSQTVYIADDGTVGDWFMVAHNIDDIGNNGLNITAATDDGILAFWQQGADLQWTAYNDVTNYTVIDGTAGHDSLVTNDGTDDWVRAGSGDDTIVGSRGVDRFDGGEGADTLILNSDDDHVLSLASGYAQNMTGTTREALIAMENLVSGAGNDTIYGDGDSNLIDAGAGDDLIYGGGGDDTVIGGDGTDTFMFDDYTISSSVRSLTLDDAAGVELIGADRTQLSFDWVTHLDLSGVNGYSTFFNFDLDNQDGVTFIGTQAADSVYSSTGDDYINGGGGDDTLDGYQGNDTLNGGAGDDLLISNGSSVHPTTFVFDRDFGNDTISGYSRSGDVLDFSAFTDAEMDQLSVEQVGNDRVITMHDGSTLTLLSTARNYQASGNISIGGDAYEDAILTADVSAVSDTDGFDPADATFQWLRSGEAIEGATSASYTLTQADVNHTMSVQYSFTDRFLSDEVVTRGFAARINNVQDPLTGAASITGTAEVGETVTADVSGLSDEDGIRGYSYQWLADGVEIAGATEATFEITSAQGGKDLSVAVTVQDTFYTSETVTSASVAVPMSDQLIEGTANDDLLRGDIGNDTLLGLDGTDTLIGADGNDSLVGGTSEDDLRDVIYGGNGDDYLDGGYGNDELRGDAGTDTIIGGFGVDLILGGDGNDELTGQAWSDQIFGGNGDDFINGGFGYDRVNGGAGADRFFHIGNVNHGSDWIQDYNAADGDVLQFGAAGTADQFQVNFTETPNAGVAGVTEAFVIYKPTQTILWALVDGGAQSEINLLIGGETFNLLA
ncbi:calcium-binding protein [Pseudoprimorskyibacter insulae]|uniref:Leukotoxin n=1 Tax=Pseudoprimorskyibacter insulae TaxID=1695997 RepID=A0A2R8AV02_9RHOB|nr:hypothetical protein [Pseudoprimorskyibacter insulae]SPF79868.1 Leukotoxin [Pseudoprimorskyibacter insulae]